MNVPTRTFRPRSHLAPFVEGSHAWLVLVKNAIPVAGLYWLDWSIDVIVLQIWTPELVCCDLLRMPSSTARSF